MSARYYVVVECAICEFESDPVLNLTVAAARKHLADYGWRHVPKTMLDVCPRCVGEHAR